MTQTHNEDAIQRMASMEDGVSVTAGSLDTEAFYRRVERQRAMSPEEREALHEFVKAFFTHLASK